nr:hypothetical protein [Tanacetum cinerariifolium]
MESVFHISSCVIENQVKFATCTMLDAALTWWNGHLRTLGHDPAYVMTWETLKKKMTDKYCLMCEIKKLEIELWNLKVKGNDVRSYTQRLQEFALICTKFVSDEKEKVDKYINGLPDNIHGNVMCARPKTLDEAIEQNMAQAYAVRTGERKKYAGTLPLCNKCKFHHNGPCTIKCANCKKVDHLIRDCWNPTATRNQKTITCYECGNQGHYMSDCLELKNRNHGNQAEGTRARRMVYALGGGETNQDLNDIEDDINA